MQRSDCTEFDVVHRVYRCDYQLVDLGDNHLNMEEKCFRRQSH